MTRRGSLFNWPFFDDYLRIKSTYWMYTRTLQILYCFLKFISPYLVAFNQCLKYWHFKDMWSSDSLVISAFPFQSLMIRSGSSTTLNQLLSWLALSDFLPWVRKFSGLDAFLLWWSFAWRDYILLRHQTLRFAKHYADL